MSHIIDKRDRAQLFRQRLASAMADQNMSQSALARAIGTDRSTISQVLKDEGARLPNAHVVGACAAALSVSADWLLALSARPESATQLLAMSNAMTEAPRAMVDEQIFAWHREAAGYKIRHVPAALPDMLKTPQMLRWEYTPHLGRTTDQAIGASEDRLKWMRSSSSDYEIALPASDLASFAQATGYYEGLPAEIRIAQIAHIGRLYDQLFPRLRLFLFDSRQVFSAPLTVFGPLLAVLYVGRYYLSFRDNERVDHLTGHFDMLVKQATVTDRDIPDHLDYLTRLAQL